MSEEMKSTPVPRIVPFEDTLAPIYGEEIVPCGDVFRMTGGPTVDWRVGISQSPQEGEFYAGPQMTCAERNTGWRILA
ncbi:MAG: hypothetical protein R3E40_03565 [Rhodocyclaceae bacterium]|nr:hypothetical protein [Rhodocyclaceae bacterium]MCP5297668.1 hypothetical protein [Zoogloeaceae bacterium]